MKQFLKLKSLKTLLIDDNAEIRDTMKMIFTKKECLLKTFETAEEGLRALERERFDIIICDFQLPGINGVEFFRRVMASHPDAIKILISGYGSDSTVSEAFKIGVHAFINKPFPTAFLERLMPYVEKRDDLESQSRDTAEIEAEPENQNQARPTGHKSKGPRRTRAKHDMRPLSYLPPDSTEKRTLSDRRYYSNQVAV